MRILVIGASGDIGNTVCSATEQKHEVIRLSRTTGDIQADMTDPKSLDTAFCQLGKLDAIVVAAGSVHFGPLKTTTNHEFMVSLENKVMGQINVVLRGTDYLKDGGSFTLTNGLLDLHPVLYGSGPALANAAVDGFVRAAALEMPRGIRINSVSPGLLDISYNRYAKFIQGHQPVSQDTVANAYLKSISEKITGQRIIGA